MLLEALNRHGQTPCLTCVREPSQRFDSDRIVLRWPHQTETEGGTGDAHTVCAPMSVGGFGIARERFFAYRSFR